MKRELLAATTAFLLLLGAFLVVTFLRTRVSIQQTRLHELRDQHPRLYTDATDWDRLREHIPGHHAETWTVVRAWTDQHMEFPWPTETREDFRRVGDLVPYAATCYLLYGRPKDLELARQTMIDLCDCEPWVDNRDIEAAHALYGLALGYDWLHDSLSPADRQRIRDKLILQANRMAPGCEQRHLPLNNHRIVNLCALGTAALALYPDGDSSRWLRQVNHALRQTLDAYGSDGLSCEGIGYWSYVTEFLLKYASAADPLLNETFLDHPWLHNAWKAPLYFSLPRNAWTADNMTLNLADSPRAYWYGPHYQLARLAALGAYPQARWLAREIQQCGFTERRADWLSLVWDNPTLAATPPTNLPLTHLFGDWDIAVLRSGWHGDETVVAFSCGPVGGHQVRPGSPYPGSGHRHPDANHVMLFGHGAWLLADAGATLVKRTAHHNTVLVNGKGQLGEGQRWFNGSAAFGRPNPPCIIHASDTGDVTYLVGDATGAYPPEAGLVRFVRHLLYLRPNLLVLVDELETAQPAVFSSHFHTPGTVALPGPGRALIRNQNATLTLAVLSSHTTLMTGTLDVPAEYPEKDWSRLARLSLQTEPTRTARLITVLALGGDPAPPLTAGLRDIEGGKEIQISCAEAQWGIELREKGCPHPRMGLMLLAKERTAP